MMRSDAVMPTTRITPFLLAVSMAFGFAPAAAQSASEIVLTPQQVAPHSYDRAILPEGLVSEP